MIVYSDQSDNPRTRGLKTCPNLKGNKRCQVKLATKYLVSTSLIALF